MDVLGVGPADLLGSIVIIIASLILYFQNKKQGEKVTSVKKTLASPGEGVNALGDKIDSLDEKFDDRFDALEREINSLHQEDRFLRRLFDAHILEADSKHNMVDNQIGALENNYQSLRATLKEKGLL